MATNFDKLHALGIEVKQRSGQTKVRCPKCSHNRKHKSDPCLSVNVDTGVYNCHNCEFKGSVGSFERQKKEFVRPPEWQNNTALSEGLVKWFAARGITQKTLIAMRIGEGLQYIPQKKKEVNTVQFPYFRSGEIVNIKYRTGDKAFKMVKDAELIFFNLDGIANKEEAIIVEGEPDCLSFIEAGITNVVSVPNGASKGSQKLEYLDNCWSDFENMKVIYIGTDNDEAGIALRNELVRRLGDERCMLIDYKDCKDGNEYMLKHGKTSMPDLLTNAKPVPIEGIFTADQLLDDVKELYEKGLPKGDAIGVAEFDEHMTFLPGQMTVITGIPNHGKSDFLDFICERLAVMKDWRFGIFSPENFPISLHLSKISEKVIGKSFGSTRKMTEDELLSAMDFIQDHFYFIRPDDENYTLDNILMRARKLVSRYGINGLIIDPWNTLEHQIPIGISETNYISNQLAKLTSFKQRYNVHIFLVAHPTKIKKDKNTKKYELPTLYDISGSANFFNKTDNGLCVYRDFSENKTVVSVQKIKFKHLGKVGQVAFCYDMASGRYYPQYDVADYSNHLISKPAIRQPQEVAIKSYYENDDDMPF